MIYGNKFLNNGIYLDPELRAVTESIREDLNEYIITENYEILQESIKEKLNKFLSIFKKKAKQEVEKIDKAETAVNDKAKRIVNMTKENIVFDKPIIIENINYIIVFSAVISGLKNSKRMEVKKQLFAIYNDALDEGDEDPKSYLKDMKKIRETMFPDVSFNVVRPVPKTFANLFTKNTNQNTFRKDFANMFKEDVLKKVDDIYETLEFKDSNAVDDYISKFTTSKQNIYGLVNMSYKTVDVVMTNLEQNMKDIDSQRVANNISERVDQEKMHDIVRELYNTIIDIYEAYQFMYHYIRVFGERIVAEKEDIIKKIDYTKMINK